MSKKPQTSSKKDKPAVADKPQPAVEPKPVKHNPSRAAQAQPAKPAGRTKLVRIRKVNGIYKAIPKKLFMSRSTGNIVFVLENAPPNAQLIKIEIEEEKPSLAVVEGKRLLAKNGASAVSPADLLAKKMAPIRKIASRNGWQLSLTKKGYLIKGTDKLSAKKAATTPIDLTHPFSFPSSDMRVMILTDDNSRAKHQGRKFRYEMFVQEGRVRLPVDPEIVNEPPPDP